MRELIHFIKSESYKGELFKATSKQIKHWGIKQKKDKYYLNDKVIHDGDWIMIPSDKPFKSFAFPESPTVVRTKYQSKGSW